MLLSPPAPAVRIDRSSGTGRYVADEAHAVASKVRGGPGVLYAPGGHSSASYLSTDPFTSTLSLVLAQNGFVVVAGDLGVTGSQGTFGNDTSRTRVGQLRAYAQSASDFRAAAGPVHLIAQSAGFLAAINYARANPANVLSVVGLVPVVALDVFHDANHAAFPSSEVEAAYGGLVAYEAAVATNDPSAAGNQAALADVPIQLWYSTNDPYVPESTIDTFAGLVEGAGGSVDLRSLGAKIHNPVTANPYVILDFLLANS